MKIKELKKLLENIPDDVEVCISDMNGESFDFEVGQYWDEEQKHLDLIIPIYIHSYNKENSEEDIILI